QARTRDSASRLLANSQPPAITFGSPREMSTRGEHAADSLDARFVQLDVTDHASVAAAAATLAKLDVLVNNAGISGGRITASEATADHMRAVFETCSARSASCTRSSLYSKGLQPRWSSTSQAASARSALPQTPTAHGAGSTSPSTHRRRPRSTCSPSSTPQPSRECGSTQSTPATPPPTSTPTEARRPSNKEPRRSSAAHSPPPTDQPAG